MAQVLVGKYYLFNTDVYTLLILPRLIALLLGRLRLSVAEAIDRYRLLAKQVFSERKAHGKDGTFKASALEKAIKDTVE